MRKAQQLSTKKIKPATQNSLRHGLTAKQLLSDEESEQFQSLVKALTREHSPNGITEELLIQDLAMLRIRLSRFDLIETQLFLEAQERSKQPAELIKKLELTDEKLMAELLIAIEPRWPPLPKNCRTCPQAPRCWASTTTPASATCRSRASCRSERDPLDAGLACLESVANRCTRNRR